MEMFNPHVFHSLLAQLKDLRHSPSEQSLLLCLQKLTAVQSQLLTAAHLLRVPPQVPGQRERMEKDRQVPGYQSMLNSGPLSQKRISEIGELSQLLLIDCQYAAQLLDYAETKAGELGRSLLETAVFLFYSHRQTVLQCLRELLLVSFGSDYPDYITLPCSKMVLDAVNSSSASLIQALLQIIKDQLRDLVSLAVEDKLGVTDALDHAKRQSLTLGKVIEKLQSQQESSLKAAIGCRIQEERNLVVRCLALLSWNTLLPDGDIMALLTYIKSVSVDDEPALCVLVASFLSQVDVCAEAVVESFRHAESGSRRMSASLHLTPDMQRNVDRLKKLFAEAQPVISGCEWAMASCRAAVQFMWTACIRLACDRSAELEKTFSLTHSKAEEALEDAISDDALSFMKNQMLPFVLGPSDSVLSGNGNNLTVYGLFSHQEDYLKELISSQMHKIVLYIASKLSDILRRMKVRDEDLPTASQSSYRSHLHESSKLLHGKSATEGSLAKPRRKDVESFLDLVSAIYYGREEAALELLDTKRSFIKTIYDDRLSLTAKQSYFLMIASFANGPQSAQAVYELLAGFSSTLSWEWIFSGLDHYASAFQQASDQGGASELAPDDLALLRSLLTLIMQVVMYSPTARVTLFDALHAMRRLFLLLSSRIPKELKAPLFRTIAAFAYTDGLTSTGFNIPWQVWSNLETLQVIPKQGHSGIVYDLKVVESKDETYPETRAFLELLNVLMYPLRDETRYSLATKSVRPGSLIKSSPISLPDPIANFGINGESPAIFKYIDYVIDEVLLPINQRAHMVAGERYAVENLCLGIIEKCILGFDLESYLSAIELSSQSKSTNELAKRNLIAHPAYSILCRVLSGSPLLGHMLNIIQDSAARMNRPDVVNVSHVSMVGKVMRILLKIFDIQHMFLKSALNTVRDTKDSTVAKFIPNVALASIDVYLMQCPKVVVMICDLVNSVQSSELALLSIKMMGFITKGAFGRSHSSGESAMQVDFGRLSIGKQPSLNRLVRLFATAPELERITSGYVNRLLSGGSKYQALADYRSDETFVTIACDHDDVNIDNEIRYSILEFLIMDLNSNTADTVFAHLILGYNAFSIRSTEFVKTDTLESGKARPVIYPLLELFKENETTASKLIPRISENSDSLPYVPASELPLSLRDARFFDALLELLFSLCLDERTCTPTVKYLRYCEDFFARSAKLLPMQFLFFHITSEYDVLRELVTHQLHHVVFLLRLISLEIHISSRNHEKRHGYKLLPALLNVSGSSENADFGLITNYSASVDVLSFLEKVSTFDVPTELSSEVSEKFKTAKFFGDFPYNEYLMSGEAGCPEYDILKIYESLQSRLKAKEVTGELRTAYLVEEASLEIKNILEYLQLWNEVNKLKNARSRCVIACKQCIETCIVYLFDANVVGQEQQHQILNDVITTVLRLLINVEFSQYEQDYISCILVPAFGKLRLLSAQSPQGSSQQKIVFDDNLQILDGIVANILVQGRSLTARSYLYSALVNFLQNLRKSGNSEISKSTLKKSWSIVSKNFDSLMTIVCNDTIAEDATTLKTLPLSVLCALLSLSKFDNNEGKILDFIRRTNFLKYYIEAIKREDDVHLSHLLQNESEDLSQILVFELKMTLLTSLASSSSQASSCLFEFGIIDAISSMKCLRRISFDVSGRSDEGFRVVKSILDLVTALITSVGKEQTRTIDMIVQFVRSNVTMFRYLLRFSVESITYDYLETVQKTLSLFTLIVTNRTLFSEQFDGEPLNESLCKLLKNVIDPGEWASRLNLESFISSKLPYPNAGNPIILGDHSHLYFGQPDVQCVQKAASFISTIIRDVAVILCKQFSWSGEQKVFEIPLFNPSVALDNLHGKMVDKRAAVALSVPVKILKSSIGYLKADLDSRPSGAEKEILTPRQITDLLIVVDSTLVLIYGHVLFYLSQEAELAASPSKFTGTKGFDSGRFASDLNSTIASEMEFVISLKHDDHIYGSGSRSKLNFIRAISRRILDQTASFHKEVGQ